MYSATAKICIAKQRQDIAAALASIMVILANRHYRLQIAPAIVLLLEFMALALIAVSFGCTLSLALSLSSFRTARLYTGGSAKLASFAALLSVSKVCTIITALAGFLVMMTCLMSVVDAYNRHQQSEKVCCAFEPTASALGMNHGFEALHPSEPYTSYKPRYTSYIDVKRPPMTDGLARSASQNAVMGRIGSGQSKRCQGLPDVEKDMLRLLGPEKSNDSPKPPKSARPERPAKIGRSPKPERSPKITSPETIEILTKPARPVRPVRPWSKVWNGRESMYGF
jgi:hypothetical protein